MLILSASLSRSEELPPGRLADAYSVIRHMLEKAGVVSGFPRQPHRRRLRLTVPAFMVSAAGATEPRQVSAAPTNRFIGAPADLRQPGLVGSKGLTRIIRYSMLCD